ncbi:Exonuclease SbcC [Actinacidiphila cocklensis]|uniref:Exonuclease SbcC n=1 Tax=Actinacidiphila cocklensis TaxID=887465 RepID=A0A9W4DVB5_9ACTN|nr:Exonuclease SbcC [Actinacidiphila cocklensis]
MAHREQQVQGSGKRRPTLGLVPTMDSPPPAADRSYDRRPRSDQHDGFCRRQLWAKKSPTSPGARGTADERPRPPGKPVGGAVRATAATGQSLF